MSLRTLKDRLDLLGMEPHVLQSIMRGELDPYVALRAGQTAQSLARHRPEMTERSGGKEVVTDKLIKKGKKQSKGKTREFEQIKAELGTLTSAQASPRQRFSDKGTARAGQLEFPAKTAD